jgi:hypothetical protein
LIGRIKGCLLVAFSWLMRRAYPALFCFQEVIEIFWKVFSQLRPKGSATRKS